MWNCLRYSLDTSYCIPFRTLSITHRSVFLVNHSISRISTQQWISRNLFTFRPMLIGAFLLNWGWGIPRKSLWQVLRHAIYIYIYIYIHTHTHTKLASVLFSNISCSFCLKIIVAHRELYNGICEQLENLLMCDKIRKHVLCIVFA